MVSDNEVARHASLDTESMLTDLDELEFKVEELDFEELGLIDFKMPEILEPEDLSDKNKEIDTDNFGNDLEHTCPKCGFSFNE